ncbi:BglG family transcription antiterminator LicT [Candidatus Stoquefichus massiliensis]|uniref:BglG family transcription antiterminator LicT n=1 Tax=Candidatus Stoquefichus massiliensis TaxID=1470350 RepID=UPI0004893EF9|nr:PRD domain-containing protein [Candidatus Stoquefichus massiliensis]
MIIKKILNNNVVITFNDQHEEIVVMGKGLAYGKRTGESINPEKISKIFELSLKESQKKMIDMLKDIPIEYMEISDQVIQKAKKELNSEVDDSLYISLTDHIHTSIERYKEGIPIKNQLLLEIKHFYKKEFELGLWALSLIEAKYHIRMDDDEAGFIAMHIVSSEVGRNISDVYEMTEFIQGILELVKSYFQKDFDEDSLSYYRFVTHLKFFGLRVFNQTKQHQDESLNNDLLEIMKEKYVQPYLCALEIKNFIERKYSYYLEDEEVLFLTIHVAKIVSHK